MYRFALRLLKRDWRSGELTLLLAALMIAVGSVTGITLFIDRLNQALLIESAAFLAADRAITSSRETPVKWQDFALSKGLETGQTLDFSSMVFNGDESVLASVKAVSDSYPLRGRLQISDQPFTPSYPVNQGPRAGSLWVETRLLGALGIELGDTIEVGAAQFTVDHIINREPDRGSFFSYGPRVLMNINDVDKTQVVQPGARLSYRYLVAGDDQALDQFIDYVTPQLGPGQRLISVKDNNQSIGTSLGRAESFLQLGGLLAVILAGIALALSARRYTQRHQDPVAVLKTFGATPHHIQSIMLTQLIVLGVTGIFLGFLLGYLAQSVIIFLLQSLLPVVLPAAGIKPYLMGGLVGMLCLLAFALPPFLELKHISPLRVLRREFQNQDIKLKAIYLSSGLLGFVMMWWYSGDIRLTLFLVGGILLTIGLFTVLSLLLLRGGRVLGMQAGSAWRLGLAALLRARKHSITQMLIFGSSLMVLLVLFFIRTDLISEWQAQIPEGAPNHYFINIAPEEVQGLTQLMQSEQIQAQEFYPLIRGRISAINGISVLERDDETPQQRQLRQSGERASGRSANRERNLTMTDQLPKDNEIIEGNWWQAQDQGKALVSVEKDIADWVGIKLGDELTFTIGALSYTAKVHNIRAVKWDNLQPNFYMIFAPGSLTDYPTTYMTSFYLPSANKTLLNELLRNYPTISVFEVDEIIKQVKSLIDRVSLAIESVLILVLSAGALVLMASIQAGLDERLQQHAVLRTLGASSKLMLGSLLTEFCTLGLFAGILATFGAEITVFALQVGVFQQDYQPHFWMWLIGPLLGLLIIGLTGTLATLKVVRTPPMTLLRTLG